MKALVIGLGSMGKRRIRNLIANNISDITGFDTREDRRTEAKNNYSIKIIEKDLHSGDLNNFDVIVISTPPNLHMHYAYMAFEVRKPTFIEASVTDLEKIRELDQMNNSLDKPVVFAPSCTMRFFPGPKLVKSYIENNEIGKTLYFNYCTGQYLPDWHPWEDIQDFYVSKRDTGGAREIVPFEMTWINDIWGTPKVNASTFSKLSDINADIDDFYTATLEYPKGIICNLTVEVLSRPISTRELRVIGSKGVITYSADSNSVRLHKLNNDGKSSEVKEVKFDTGTVESQYINPEEPYIKEVASFLDAAKKL